MINPLEYATGGGSQMRKPTLRLLHIDDEPRVRQLVRELVTDELEAGCEFSEGGRGQDAEALYEQHRPDVVLMDYEMEDLDGLSAMSGLIDHFPEARVIFLTLHDLPDIRHAAEEAGAIAFLSKSEITDLPELLATLL